MTDRGPTPTQPRGLGARGDAYWRHTVATYTQSESEHLRAAVEHDGVVVTGAAGQPRGHPLLTELRGHRGALARLVAQLSRYPPTTTPRCRRLGRCAVAGVRLRVGEATGMARRRPVAVTADDGPLVFPAELALRRLGDWSSDHEFTCARRQWLADRDITDPLDALSISIRSRRRHAMLVRDLPARDRSGRIAQGAGPDDPAWTEGESS